MPVTSNNPAPKSMTKRPLIQMMRERWNHLDTEYSSWRAHQWEISRMFMPKTGRFFVEDRNKGWKRNEEIIDNTGTRAVRILGAGLTAGASSPARPWLKIKAANPDLNRMHDVQLWLDEVTRIVMHTFSQSNTYFVLQQLYEETPLYGTGCALIVRDEDKVIRLHSLTAGQYRLATGPDGEVNCMYRELQMTVAQLVREFGIAKCSDRVSSMFREGQLEEGITIYHAIEPREDRDTSKIDNKNMPWRSVYWEAGEATEITEVLNESGFLSFPVLAPRWSVAPEDVYGNGPGMEALPDVIQLQQEQFRKGQAIDFATKPPVLLPSDMKNHEVDLSPGGENYADAAGANVARPIWQVGLQLAPLLEDIRDVRSRINASFFVDMFMMIAQTDKRMTATEVAERHEEKLLMLGPALERLHTELLEKLVDLTFEHLIEAGRIPEPPPELSGSSLDVEFISMLAQAQRAAGAGAIDRFVASVGAVAQMKPDVLDKVDADAYVDDLADRLGVPADLLISTEEALSLRKARAKMQAEQAQAEMQAQQAGALKDAGSAASDMATAASLAASPPEQMFSQIAGS